MVRDQEEYLKNLEILLSAERLGVYGADGAEPREVIARYLWNMALCESLYAPLQFFEIGLRNAIDRAIRNSVGVPNWFDVIYLTPWGQRKVVDAKRKIISQRRPVNAGRVVAELPLGFWTSMFESHYERPSAKFLPSAIKQVFPMLPKSEHNRKRIKLRLEQGRRLRNRVFHHERIVHWKDLASQHESIREVMRWISFDLDSIVGLVDCFPRVYADGIQPYLDQLKDGLSD
ncbi:MAG: hypothetical protein ACF8MF_00990 [Phycisphaerales bacterium JB052]